MFIKNPVKIITALTIGSVIGYVLWQYPIGMYLPVFIQRVQNLELSGYLLYVIVSAIGTAMFFPGSIFVMGAGFVWGVAYGTLIASASLTISAALTFYIGRYIARDWVKKMVNQNTRLKQLDTGVMKSGFKFVFLIRLSPAFPFTLFNYSFGSTGVRFGDYILATWLGMIPGTIMYVYIGSIITEIAQIASGNLSLSNTISYYKALGLIAAVAAIIYISRSAYRILSDDYRP